MKVKLPVLQDDELEGDLVDRLSMVAENNKLKHMTVEPLRFYDLDSSGCPRYLEPRIERIRNEIWKKYFEENKRIPKISHEMDMHRNQVRQHLGICKMRYDEWIARNGLEVYGNAAHRLYDHIETLTNELEEIREERELCEVEKDRIAYRKLELEIREKIAKYKGIQPAVEVNHHHTIADESREKMKALFAEPIKIN